MFSIPWRDNKKGISVVEILIVIAIISIALTSLLGLALLSLQVSTQMKENIQAINLAQEAIEAVRNIRDNSNWTKLVNGNHGLTNAGGYWDFVGTENIINGFTRTILIEDVYRDNTPGDSEATDDIETDGVIEASDYLDPNTKKITVSVSWKGKRVEIVTYLTNWRQ